MFKAKTIMNSDVISVSPTTDIYEAIRTLLNYNITGLPVVNDQEELVGILSEKDVLSLMVNAEDCAGHVVDFMSPEVTTFDENDSLVDIAECFIKHSFRRVPILSEGKLAGVISRRDIVRYILKLRHQDMATYHC